MEKAQHRLDFFDNLSPVLDGTGLRFCRIPCHSIPISSARIPHCRWARSASIRNTAPVSGSTARAVYSAMQFRVR